MDEIDQGQINEWCRHIDGMTWTMGGILTAAIGGLALYTIEHPNLWTSLCGLILTGVIGYLIESFRATRRRLHSHIDPRLVDLLRPPSGLKQWPVFLLILVILTVTWVCLLIVGFRGLSWLWIILGIANMLLTFFWFRRADQAQTNNNCSSVN